MENEKGQPMTRRYLKLGAITGWGMLSIIALKSRKITTLGSPPIHCDSVGRRTDGAYR